MQTSLPEVIFLGEHNQNLSWIAFTDDVIGGHSTGDLVQHKNYIEFKGHIEDHHNGGWVGMRSRKEPHNLSSYKFIELKIKTDGKPYHFQMEHQMSWEQEKLSTVIDIVADQWKIMHLEIADFKLYDAHRGYIHRKVKPEYLDCIYRYNLLAIQLKSRPFNFQIEYVRFH